MKNIALIAGGESSEWQIALKGADMISKYLDRSRYNVYKIILHDGHWRYTDPEGRETELDRNDFSLTVNHQKINLEYAIILIHGTPGEDGRLQGYLDMMHVPYSSCGFVCSVITFDKSACKRAVADTGVSMAREVLLNKNSPVDQQAVITALGLPLFVKPNASGSSFGVTKVKTADQFLPAVEKAFTESDQVLVEEFIRGREISRGVMIAAGEEFLFPITELVSETEFFDYDAKYMGRCNEITPASLDSDVTRRIDEKSLAIYKMLGCRGVVRIDFIIKDNEPYLIEVNTIPGMSEQSIIPQQAREMGMSITELYNRIIEDTSTQAY